MVSSGNHSATLLAFSDHFSVLMPLLLEEWPQLNPDELQAINDDLDQTITYIAEQTEHTQTLVRRHLAELASLAMAPTSPPAIDLEVDDTPKVATTEPLGTASAESHAPGGDDSSPSNIDQLLGDLESRAEQLMQEFKAEMLPELEKKARSNLGMSLLMALGFGVILGLLLGGRRG